MEKRWALGCRIEERSVEDREMVSLAEFLICPSDVLELEASSDTLSVRLLLPRLMDMVGILDDDRLGKFSKG